MFIFPNQLGTSIFSQNKEENEDFLCLLEEEIRWLHIWGFLENQTFVKVCLEKGTGVFPFAISTIIKIRNDLPFPCRQSFILLEGKCKSWCGHILFVSTAKEDTFLTPDIFTFFFYFGRKHIAHWRGSTFDEVTCLKWSSFWKGHSHYSPSMPLSWHTIKQKGKQHFAIWIFLNV